ncbi:MAG: hypothetical protein QOE31_93 [Solirubrobacteraceae bacterium]|nr:hypothetical protein [Solirubrobacteraceae bacterium]
MPDSCLPHAAAPAPRSGAVGGSTSTSTAAGGSCGAKLFAPLRGKVASPFGDGRLHAGIDISAPVGTSVLAAACGTVTLAGRQSGYGKIVCIRHTQSFSTCYAHLSTFAVKPGSPVVVGQLIGRVGMTGRTSGPHLHFETRVDGRAQNPAPFLRGSRRIPGATAPASSPAPEAQATGGARPATTPR